MPPAERDEGADGPQVHDGGDELLPSTDDAGSAALGRQEVRPLHLLGGGGIIILMMGVLVSLYAFYLFCLGQDMSNTVLPLLSVFLITSGIQLFIFGLMADIMMKVYFEKTRDIPYSIQEYVENINPIKSKP